MNRHEIHSNYESSATRWSASSAGRKGWRKRSHWRSETEARRRGRAVFTLRTTIIEGKLRASGTSDRRKTCTFAKPHTREGLAPRLHFSDYRH